jgi:hypothetical protein
MTKDPRRVSVPVLSDAGRVAAALALLGIVALASTSRVERGGSTPHSRIGLVFLAVAAVSLLVVAFAGGLLGGYASFAETRRRTKLLAAVIAVLLLTALGASLLAPVYGPSGEYKCAVMPCLGTGKTPGQGQVKPGGGSHGGWSMAEAVAGGALLAALLVVGAGMLLAARGRAAFVSEPDVDEVPMSRAVDDSIDDLRRERDVRRAIIASYARMERALARSGAARRVQEAPFEYLNRILGQVSGAGAAVRALTELFEQAKFSVEPMGVPEKERAIAALEELRVEVYP